MLCSRCSNELCHAVRVNFNCCDVQVAMSMEKKKSEKEKEKLLSFPVIGIAAEIPCVQKLLQNSSNCAKAIFKSVTNQ